MKLVFKHLYDDKYAYFPKKEKWQTPVIVLASGFVPEVGKSYECYVSDTMTGSFVYDGIRYDLSIARLSDEADALSLLENKFENLKKKEGLTVSMADVFRNAKKKGGKEDGRS